MNAGASPVTIDVTPAEEFHGLRSRPFSLTPDLRFTFHSKSHTQAIDQISTALKRREGLVVVTGEVGTGKTMLCRALLDTFETRTFLSVILDPLLTVEDLLHQVLTDFGLMRPRDRSQPLPPLTEVARHDLVSTLQKFLASLVPLNAHAVIMIDEAQHLTGPVLEQVRLLSNFETDSAKLLQIVLVGQPNLDILLERPDMRQLNQRVARRYQLSPLSEKEVGEYIERRLLVASDEPGADAKPSTIDLSNTGAVVRFSPSAAALVAKISAGIPRLVNTLSDRALEAAYERKSHVVDRDAVLAAADRLRLPVPSSGLRSRRTVGIAAAGLAAAIGVWWWTHPNAIPRPSFLTPAAGGRIAPAPPPAAAAPGASPGASGASSTNTAAAPTPATDPAAAPAPGAPAPAAPGASSAGAAPAAEQPTSPRASVPPAPATITRYEITAASFRTEERARAVVASIGRAGLPVAAQLDSTGQWYRVVVGPFDSMDDARAAQDQLEARGFMGTRLISR